MKIKKYLSTTRDKYLFATIPLELRRGKVREITAVKHDGYKYVEVYAHNGYTVSEQIIATTPWEIKAAFCNLYKKWSVSA